MNEKEREKIIVTTSVVGILTNVLLVAIKMAIGLLSNSLAVILDAVNNLSDAMSSVITIVGAKLANRPPNKKHPMGYGRIEYLTSMIVAGIVLYAGITAFVESFKKILDPTEPEYSYVSVFIIAVAVLVKVVLGLYVKSRGKKVNSIALTASGSEALFDAILSASVLVCVILHLAFHLNLEAWVGLVIAAFIVKTGLEMMIETLNDILGKRADTETVQKVKELIRSEEGVRGAYDLIINNYGPNKDIASVHVELPDTMTVEELDRLTRRLEEKVYRETGIILTGVGVYSYNTKNDEAADIRNRVAKAVLAFDYVLQMHGFYLDQEQKTMRFDAVISFGVPAEEAVKTLTEAVLKEFPGYQIHITPDVDVSD